MPRRSKIVMLRQVIGAAGVVSHRSASYSFPKSEKKSTTSCREVAIVEGVSLRSRQPRCRCVKAP